MVYTLTLNPAIDYYLYLDEKITDGKFYRAKEANLRSGGKGINVSIMLTRLGISSISEAFIGGIAGDFIENEMKNYSLITFMPIRIKENNRINVKIRSIHETDINTSGPTITGKEKNSLLNNLKALNKNDYLIISGSLPKGVNPDYLIKIAKIAKKANAKLILDVPNMTLLDLVECNPFMIKPNEEELQQIFKNENQKVNYIKQVDYLIKKGVQSVLLSLGSDGAYYADIEHSYRLTGPKLKAKNTVGCGDTMLAYTIGKLIISGDVVSALKFGEAAGCAAATTKYLPDKTDINKMLSKVRIKCLK